MKNKYLKISKPCQQQWEKMKPEGQGRFCELCDKNVIDLTQMTMLEITEIIRNSKGNICGRVTKEQLKFPILDVDVPKRHKLPYFKLTAGLMMATTLVAGQPLHAGHHNSRVDIVQTDGIAVGPQNKRNKPASVNPGPDDFVLFKGRVKSDQGRPLKNAAVIFVSAYKILTSYTAKDGSFSLQIPRELIREKNVIQVKYSKVDQDSGKDMIRFYTNDLILTEKEIRTFHTIKAEPFELEPYPDVTMGAISFSSFCDEESSSKCDKESSSKKEKKSHVVIIYQGSEIDYEAFLKAPVGESIFKDKEVHYFNGEIAVALYGEKAREGLYVLIDQEVD